MQHFNPQMYGPVVAALLTNAKLNELGPGTPELSMRAPLAALKPKTVVEPRPLVNREMALASIAGLWLRHDFLDDSHRISQDLDNPSGSYWHAIMHRREGDFSNSKYWFHRVGDHSIFRPLQIAAHCLAGQDGARPAARFLVEQSQWDPLGFVDLCENALHDSHPVHRLCMKIQQCEWELLFDDCYREAIDD